MERRETVLCRAVPCFSPPGPVTFIWQKPERDYRVPSPGRNIPRRDIGRYGVGCCETGTTSEEWRDRVWEISMVLYLSWFLGWSGTLGPRNNLFKQRFHTCCTHLQPTKTLRDRKKEDFTQPRDFPKHKHSYCNHISINIRTSIIRPIIGNKIKDCSI